MLVIFLAIFLAPYIAGKATKTVLYKPIQLWKKAIYIIAIIFLIPLTVVGFLGGVILAVIGTDASAVGEQAAVQSVISIIICAIYITIILIRRKMKNKKSRLDNNSSMK